MTKKRFLWKGLSYVSMASILWFSYKETGPATASALLILVIGAELQDMVTEITTKTLETVVEILRKKE